MVLIQLHIFLGKAHYSWQFGLLYSTKCYVLHSIMFHAYIKVLYGEGVKVKMIGRNLSTASEYNLMS